jgi:hypothetical protein
MMPNDAQEQCIDDANTEQIDEVNRLCGFVPNTNMIDVSSSGVGR